MHVNVFVMGCTLTLGTLTPGLNIDLVVGHFIGYIDEVRIWSRPHNPTIITQNWKMVINSDTADVSHSWTFNEGIGLIAKENRKGESFIFDDALNPPTWKKSDLDLTSNNHLKAPVLTTEEPISDSQLTDAKNICNNLIDALTSAESSDIDATITAFKDLCVQEMTRNNDTSQAESVLASVGELYQVVNNQSETPLASMCNDLSTLTTYIGYSGTSCTACVFGTMMANVCKCFETHWGATCDSICPVGPHGACNTFGVCDSVVGGCNCFSHYYGSQTSAVLYWSNFISSTTMVKVADYSCDTCADGWLGNDCYFAQATATSSTVSVAFAFGSYITTLDGISLTFITPGVYRLLQTTNIEIQALFVPCWGSHLCRYLQEISFKDSQSTISIQYVVGGNLTIWFDGETLEYPSTKVSSSMSINWSYKMLYPRVTFGGSSVLVFSSSLGLVSAFKIATSESGSSTGLLGNSDGNWVNDLNCVTGIQVTDESLMTGSYVGGCIRERYTPKTADIFIHHELGSKSLSSAGFVLHLEIQTLTVYGYPLHTGFPKLTFSFWSRVLLSATVDMATARYSLMLIDTGSYTLEIISNNGKLEIDWDQLYQTNRSFILDKWTYFVFTWSNDGLWYVYLITEYDVIVYTGPSTLTGATVNLGTMTVTGTSDIFIEVDYIRAWSDTKSLESAVADMKVYTSSYSAGLLMTLMLDDGTGLNPSVLTFAANGSVTKTAAEISGKGFGRT